MASTERPRVSDMVCTSCTGIDPDQSYEEPIGPTSAFSADESQIFVVWRSALLAEAHIAGAAKHVIAAWIAEDVGDVAPPETLIGTAGKKLDDLIAEKPMPKTGEQVWYSGNFSLTKPNNGWPKGRYRTDIIVDFANGDQEIAGSVKFTVGL